VLQQRGVASRFGGPDLLAPGNDHATGHPVIRSLEPGENWLWCYADELIFVLRDR
jgi:hypothetical protein